MIDRPVGWFEGWLGKQKPYTPAPYEQLATVLRNEGKPDVADEILYAGKEQERSQSVSMRYIAMTANRWVIGYGYHKFWSIYWAMGPFGCWYRPAVAVGRGLQGKPLLWVVKPTLQAAIRHFLQL